MSKDIAIIGASYLQLPLIEKAKVMGYTTHVFAWKANDAGETEADVFYPISIIEKEKILEVCRKIGICGICSIASDVAVLTVNYVAERMGLTGNSEESSLKSTNKYLMREAFAKSGDPSPKSYLIDEKTDIQAIDISFPVIVKPTDRSGSRGICKLESEEGMNMAVKDAMSQSFESKALIEEYVEGEEYSVEYISCNGKHYFLALTKKYTTGAPHFIETGHMEPALVNKDVLEKIKRIVSHALDTLEIKFGASHSEIKIDHDGMIKIIEIGARMGGDCIGSDLVYYSTGYDYLKMVIQIACGEEPVFKQERVPEAVEIVFIITEDDIKEFERLKKDEPDKLIKVIVDFHPERIGKTTDSTNRAGCYMRRV